MSLIVSMRQVLLPVLLLCSALSGCARPDISRGARELGAPAGAPLARITVSLLGALVDEGTRIRRPVLAGHLLRTGDCFRFTVQASTVVHAYLFDVDPQGAVQRLFPRADRADDERVLPGVLRVIPPRSCIEFTEAAGGAERIFLVASQILLDEQRLDEMMKESLGQIGQVPPPGALADPRLWRGVPHEHVMELVRSAKSTPACDRSDAELDSGGVALLCLSFQHPAARRPIP